MPTKSKFKFLIFFLAFVAVGVLISNHAFSQDTPDTHGIKQKRFQAQVGKRKGRSPGNIHLGPLIINPSFGERLEYDDNVFQVSGKGTKPDGQRERKKSDIINIVSPGLKLTLPIRGGRFLPGKEHSISIDWKADYKNYRDNAQQNQHNHFFLATGIFHFPKGFDVLFQNSYVDTFGASGGETDNLHGVITNTGSVTLSLPDYFRKFDADFTYTNFDQQYDERGLRGANRNTHTFTLRIPYNITPKITVFPAYSYGFTEYDSQSVDGAQSDSHVNSIIAGVEWAATAKTTGIFKVGYVYQDYDNIDTHNINTAITHLGMNVDLSKRMQLKILAGREPNVSEFTSGSTGFIRNFGRIDFSRRVWKDLNVSIYGSFDKNSFLDSERKEHIYGFGLSSRYAINKWMIVDLKYSNRDRHSNFELQSDRINKASLGVNFAF
ncbi:MAG: outer membrane beta-barrel protein [Candidatus Scalindua sp.]